jgi:hypothetical protein
VSGGVTVMQCGSGGRAGDLCASRLRQAALCLTLKVQRLARISENDLWSRENGQPGLEVLLGLRSNGLFASLRVIPGTVCK